MFLNRPVQDYLDRLASEKPIPGGGSVSALVGSLGIGLILMVARITLQKLEGNPKETLKKFVDHLEKLRAAAEKTVDEDPKVYEAVMDAYRRLKKAGHVKEVEEDVQTALNKSFHVQADLCLLLVTAKKLLCEVGRFAKGSIKNDLIVANGMLAAAFEGAHATANINVVYMEQGKKRRHCEHLLEEAKTNFQKTKFES